jgi:ParB family chromosome partitioning protein
VAGVKINPKRGKIIPGGRTDMLKEMAEGLSETLNTVVKIQIGRKKGQLVIEFGNVADLRRIVEDIQKGAAKH